MIVLNECRIDSDNKRLIIEATVDNLHFYKDVYIDSIVIDTDETFSASGPSHNPIYKKEFSVNNHHKHMDKSSKENKHIRLVLGENELPKASLLNNMFFIYIIASGVPSHLTPCGMDNSYVIGVAVNLKPIYNKAMGYIREIENDCNYPKGFIDMILRLNALKFSLKTGNFIEAIKYWNRLFKGKLNTVIKSNCGCGRSN